MITDGSYDVFVVDATALDASRSWSLDLTILTGEHKGEVVTVVARNLEAAEFDLLGMPGTLTVVRGEPSFRVDR